ncbi:MAG: hypothetical protein HOE53_01840, partial [Candidatus Magasanikbacteria bacterium]|nr:hypothetical protein [Candidatus Magasanikbacteria bacterium]
MSNELENNEQELISELSRQVKGVGSGIAYSIAEDFENEWLDFLKSDFTRLSLIIKSNKKRILSDLQIEDLLKVKKEYSQYTDIDVAWIAYVGRDFLKRQIEMLESISFQNMDINPFLMKVLDLNTPQSIVEFNLYQTVTRSIVTSWGNAVEKLLIRCGATKVDKKYDTGNRGKRPDIQKKNGDKLTLIQVKSGPNTMNVGMVESLNDVIQDYNVKEPNVDFLLGMTYGTRDRISSQIRNNMKDFETKSLIGKEFWDFISGEKNFHKKI